MTDPIQDDDFIRSVIETAKKDLQEAARVAEETTHSTLQMWKELAGRALDGMLRERAIAEEHLFDPSPKVRLTALWVLSDHWGLTDRNALECERMANEDADQEVVCVAVTSLGEYYAKTNDKRIGGLLATFVRNNTLAPQIRAVSYNALLTLRGIPMSEWRTHFTDPSYYSNFDEEGVEWGVVDSYLEDR